MQPVKVGSLQQLARRSTAPSSQLPAPSAIFCFYIYRIALTMKQVSLPAPQTHPAQRHGMSAENRQEATQKPPEVQ